MNILEIKRAVSKLSNVDEQDASDIVGLLALNFANKSPVSDALIDVVLSIEAHIDAAKTVKEPS